MTVWWRSLRVLPALRRRERVRFRRVSIFGLEQLENRQLLAVVDIMTAGFAPSMPSATMPENGIDVAGFVVSKSIATVAESGTTDTFTVVLTAQPELDVVLALTSADTGEATVSPEALTFTPADWNTPQLVTVTGVDDDGDDGTQITDVSVSIDAEFSDPAFANAEPQQVHVFVEDDDDAGLLLNKTFASVSENETTDTFTVRLTARPDTNVVLTVIGTDPGEAIVSPTVLTFSPADWDLPQTVTVTGVDDRLIDGNSATQVMVSVVDESSDDKFGGKFQAVHVSTVDNDVAGFVLSQTAVTVSESGSTDTFTIVLTAQPNDSVTLAAISGEAGEATVSPAVLTFAPGDWDVPQTVTVTGVDDPRIDGSQMTSVTVSVADPISDSQFAGVADQTVSVTTTDDDVAGFTFSKSLAIVSETGTTDTFSVVLTAQPETGVTLTVTSSDTGEATVSPAVLVFSTEGWDSPQTVTVTGVDDASRDGDQMSVVTVAVDAARSDGYFDGVLAQTVSVTTTDDDLGWQNSNNPFDVSGNGSVDAADVLLLINYVNGNSGSPTLPSPPASPPPYYDVNNDGRCTAFDVLLVINFINDQTSIGASSAGEGEGESREAFRSSAAPLDSTSETAAVPSGDMQLVPAPWEGSTPNPARSANRAGPIEAGFRSDVVDLDPALGTSPEPVPVPAARFSVPNASDLSLRTADSAGRDWNQAVDTALEDWEFGWEALL